ncbi:unnamed protein product [Chrysodeixis includens]|uniref:G2/M phase-specific E3 ubiquitin-protein ligase n=1 Tax=Chrysodeixis includens TaxID=689277 RepID=A0A9N8L8E5_CHRIL|nr:unnamed protein product [Chrysodeixis includens]
MAPKRSGKNRLVAKLVTGKRGPCSFCHREVDDEITYGKLYAIGDVQCHYFCVLLSSCLVQNGLDEHGLFGFLYEDILMEIERAKKHKCSYCNRTGANLGCSVAQCRKQFHLPCGREKNAVSLFFGDYKSFCQSHAPKQTIPPAIMVKARERRITDGKIKKKQANFRDLKELSASVTDDISHQSDTQSVCVICYETVDGYPTLNTFWPPCCARDAWFHRTCLQRMALSAGMHYLKCPLCNDKDNFYKAVVAQGYYVPDRDAAWELEQNAFAEIYEREIFCSADNCLCPKGRGYDADTGWWCIKLCLLCGSSGAHNACLHSHKQNQHKEETQDSIISQHTALRSKSQSSRYTGELSLTRSKSQSSNNTGPVFRIRSKSQGSTNTGSVSPDRSKSQSSRYTGELSPLRSNSQSSNNPGPIFRIRTKSQSSTNAGSVSPIRRKSLCSKNTGELSPTRSKSQSSTNTGSVSPVRTKSQSSKYTGELSPLRSKSQSSNNTGSVSPIRHKSQSSTNTGPLSPLRSNSQSSTNTGPVFRIRTKSQSSTNTGQLSKSQSTHPGLISLSTKSRPVSPTHSKSHTQPGLISLHSTKSRPVSPVRSTKSRPASPINLSQTSTTSITQTPVSYSGYRMCSDMSPDSEVIVSPHVCRVCSPAARDQLYQLATSIQAVINQEERQSSRRRRGPVMPARMSLRRTKRRDHGGTVAACSTSQASSEKTEESNLTRRHLNLSTPKRRSISQNKQTNTQDIHIDSLTQTKNQEDNAQSKQSHTQGKVENQQTKLSRRRSVVEVQPQTKLSRRQSRYIEREIQTEKSHTEEIENKQKKLSRRKSTIDNGPESKKSRRQSEIENQDKKIKSPRKESKVVEPKTKMSRRQSMYQQRKHSLTQDNIENEPQTKKSRRTEVKLDFKTDSPTKILEESLKNTGKEIDKRLVEELRKRFKKPKPLSEKRKIVDDILNGVFDNLLKETKQKEAVKPWCSPKKCDISNKEKEKQDTSMEVIEIDSESPRTKQEKDEPAYYATPKKSSKNSIESNFYPMFMSPNKSKTVDILKDSSLEISAKDEIVNIDVIKLENSQNGEIYKNLDLKSPQKCQTCTLKFSPNSKEVVKTENIDMDVESFKDQYLNEVGLQRVSISDSESVKSKTKRKRRRTDKLVLKYKSKKRKKKNIEIKNKNIQLKIKWWDKHLKLKITDKKKHKKKKFKQYVLNYSENKSEVAKPEYDVTPKKRKYVKQEKSPDNLVQTSIEKFFKITPSKEQRKS